MAVPLTRLHHLTEISLHLDFETMRGFGGRARRGFYNLAIENLPVQVKMLTAHANSFARAFRREDYTLRLLGKGNAGGDWFLFHISRAETEEGPVVELDHYREKVS